MKKRILCFLCVMLILAYPSASVLAFDVWDSPRYIPTDEYKTPWTEKGNPYITNYAPWLRQLHIMTKAEAENNIASGTVGGEACQQIRQLSISPVDSKVMYFGTDTSGIYKTINGGKHWYNVTNNSAGHDVKGLLCDSMDKEIVYAYMSKVGVHRSRDGGYSWELLIADTDTTQDIRYRSDTIVQDSAGNTYMCVGSGIYKLERATDILHNLTAKEFPALSALEGDNGAEFLDLAVSPDGQIIYACCTLAKSGTEVETGLYVSEDGGNTWEIRNASDDGKASYDEIRTLALDPSDSSCKTIYAGLKLTDTSTQTVGDYNLYKSTDGGKNYTKVYRPENMNKENIYFYGLKFGPKNTSGKYPLYLHLSNTVWPLRVSYNYDESYVSFSQVYSESDKMDKDTIRSGYTGYLYQAFQPDMTKEGTADVRLIYAASGIYEYIGKYYDAENICVKNSISRISSGYSGASITDIAFDSKNRMFMTVTDIGTYISDGTVYTKDSYPTFVTGDGTKYGIRAVFDPNDDNHVITYIGESNGHGTYCGIKQSNDGGMTFADFNEDAKLYYSENSSGWTEYGNARVLCYDIDDPETIYSSYHNSYDNGLNWKKNNYFILAINPKNTKSQVAIDGKDAGTELYKTTDGGKTWSKVMNLGFSDISDAKFDLNDENCVWFTRKNSGQSKNLICIDTVAAQSKDYTQKLGYKAFRQIEINPKNPNHILLTSYPGRITDKMKDDFKLAESFDGGENWHTVPGLWGGNFDNIIFSPTTNEVFIIGTSGTFIYDYEKFNYYQNIEFHYAGNSIYKELPRVNENGLNVNNGKYIIAPDDLFNPKKKLFTGWKINGKTYMPSEFVTLEN